MTRPLIMWNLVTLDGLFEGAKKWDLDFHEYAWGDELQALSLEQLNDADAILYGRVTYEGMAAYWSKAKGETAELMNAIPKVVFSRTLQHAEWNNTTLIRDDAAAEVKRLKSASGRKLFVFGSADLSASLIEHDLFDEYRLCLVPVLLRAGTPLFKPGSEPKRLSLSESRPLSTGGVLLHYRPKRD